MIMKRILTIQDISCLGKCSLTVALPIISAMGIETCVIPTAVLSTHTAFKDFTFHDLTSDIPQIIDHWKNEKINFDAIYTGYLGSFQQLNIMHQLIDNFISNDTIKIIDPCMADFGKLYTGFTTEFVQEMASLCSKADIIVPNMTEASYLLNIPYIECGYNKEYIEEILKKLASLGAKRVVLKGVQFSNQGDDNNSTKKIGIATYDSQSERFGWYFHEKIDESFHGTGDIFASVLTGAIMRGISLENACKLAADFVVEAIKNTVNQKDYNWYGVNFESAIPFLVNKLTSLPSDN